MVRTVGKLKVFWNGKIFVGPHLKGLVVSLLLILIPSVLFLGLAALDISVGAFLYSFFLMIFCLIMLGLTAFSNPGIIPKGHPPSRQRSLMAHPPTKDHQINGYTVTTKYCVTCQLYRIPRCSHCAVCDNCVEKFDHYCPWVGTCIGRRNYRYFLLFVFSATTLCISVFALSLYRLVKLSEYHQHSFGKAIGREPIAIMLIVYTFVTAWFVGGLTVFHSYLVMTNQTTYEHFRRRFGRNGNPYDRGLLQNISEACFQRAPPYGWDGDGENEDRGRRASLRIGLPKGAIVDPTLIAMRQEAKSLASSELPPRPASSHASEKLGSKPMSPCSFGAHPCRVHSISKEAELSSLDYQDSIYTTASSNFEEHIQNRMSGLNQSPQGIRNALGHDGESQTNIKQNSEVNPEPVPTTPQSTNLDLNSVEEPTATKENRELPERGQEAAGLEGTEGLFEEHATLEAAATSPSSQTISVSKKRPHISIDTNQLDAEDTGQLKKDGPNPFASPNPFAVPGDSARDLEGCATRLSVPSEEALEGPNSQVDRGEKTPCSPSTSVVDSQKGVDSPKPFRVIEGGLHGMMVGLNPGRYEELKESSPPQSLVTSETHSAHTLAGKTGEPSSTAVPQFKVPEFASKRLTAAFRSIKSASEHLMEKAGRTSGEGGGQEDEPGIVESSPGTEVKIDPGDLQRTSWRGTLRRNFRQNGSLDEQDKVEGGEEVDIIL